MKKSYLVLFSLLFTSLSFGQLTIFTDYFDTYVPGQQLACQNGTDWVTWSNQPCTPEDAMVTNAQASSVSNSVLITPDVDLVKPIPNFTTGNYSVVFKFFIPATKSGYFNVLHLFSGGSSQWAIEVYLDANGGARVNAGGTNTAQFTYTQGAWHTVEVKANMAGTNDVGSFYYNGTNIHTWVWSSGATGTGTLKQLGGVNFFGATATNEMYVDNFQLWDNLIPVELASFTAQVGNGNVTLNWSTASELNNRGFEVQRRSADGPVVTLGFVQGQGTTTEIQNYSFVDQSAIEGKMFYRLKQLDFDGRHEYSDEIEVEAIGNVTFMLHQNYPNPFNPSTKFNYSLPEAGQIRLAIYNLVGEEVALLVDEYKNAGTYEVTFDAGNLPSGAYLYKLQSDYSTVAKKMLLAK